MKKLSRKHRERQRRLMGYRLRADAIKRRLALRKKDAQKKLGGEICTLHAPSHFDFAGHRAETLLKFIHRLERSTANPNIGLIRIEFARTNQMVADGTLYFLATLEQLRARYPKKQFSMRAPSDRIVRQVLHHVGIAQLLENSKPPPMPLDETVRHWHKACGLNVNTERAENIFDSFEGKITPALSSSVYAGVSEAMTNCCHHAYLQTNTPPGLRKWWLFSREYKNELHVVFCDLGIGIPKSLYQESDEVDAGWWRVLQDWMTGKIPPNHKPNDALKIKAAIEIGCSRTKLGYRGKGLQQMVGILDTLGNHSAKVSIYSGNGVYRRIPKKGKATEYTLNLCTKRNHPGIKGTMIYWSIPLPQKETAK